MSMVKMKNIPFVYAYFPYITHMCFSEAIFSAYFQRIYTVIRFSYVYLCIHANIPGCFQPGMLKLTLILERYPNHLRWVHTEIL